MKRGSKWCALATCGHIPAPEIRYHGNAGLFGQLIGIPDLQGEGVIGAGAVSDSLSM